MDKPKESTKMDAGSLVLSSESDVILVVGEEQFRIHADSLVLKRHSPVFGILFGPNFREGQDLSTSAPKEITMPDDDPSAMTAICATMYLDHDHIPRSPTTDFILSIIRHADKYDCCDVLALPSQDYGWLKTDHLTLGTDLVNILAGAYLVGDQEAFKNASKTMISKYGGSFADLADDIICDVLPWKTFCRLEELRTRIQTIAISITITAQSRGYGYVNHLECSQVAQGVQNDLKRELSVEVRQTQGQKHGEPSYGILPHLAATRQSPIGPLLESLQDLAKACNECNKNVKGSEIDTFCLGLAGNNLRQVAMLPEWYWGLNFTD